MPNIGDIKFHLFTFSDKNTMNVQNIPKSKWLASSGKIKQVVRLQNVNDPGGGGTSITVRQKVKMRPKAKPFIFSNIIILDFLSKLLSIFAFFNRQPISQFLFCWLQYGVQYFCLPCSHYDITLTIASNAQSGVSAKTIRRLGEDKFVLGKACEDKMSYLKTRLLYFVNHISTETCHINIHINKNENKCNNNYYCKLFNLTRNELFYRFLNIMR